MSGPGLPPSLAPVPTPGVRGKVVSVVFGSALLGVLAVGATCVLAAWMSLNRQLQEVYPAVIRASGEGVLEHLDRSIRAIGDVAADRTFLDGVAEAADRSDRSTPDTTLLNQLSGVLLRAKVFSSLVALDEKGQVLAGVGPGAEFRTLLDALAPRGALDSNLTDLMDTAQLRKRLSGVLLPSVQMLQMGDLPSLPLASASLHDDRGRPIGSVHAFVSRAGLGERLRAEVLGANATVLLVSEAGRTVASAGPSRHSPLHKLPEALLRENYDTGPERRMNNGAWSLTAAHALGEYGFTIVIEQPVLSAYAPALMAAVGFGVMGVLAMALMTYSAARLGQGLVRPINLLYHGLRSAARDELVDQNLPLRGAVGEIESLLIAFNAMADRLRARTHETATHSRALQDQNQAFQQHHENLQKLSITDELTQLHNHRFFQDHLGREIKRLGRTGETLALLLVDIDFFKKLNDTYGHAAGDEFLRQIARIMREMVRDTDLLARYGGEEFAIVATETTMEGAMILAEKIRMSIAEASFIVDDTMRPRKATVSIGVAQFNGSRTDLFNSADAALYRAKDGGRNCVIAANDDEAQDHPELGGADPAS